MSTTCRNPRCGRPCGDFLCWDCITTLDATLDELPWLLEQLAVTTHRLDRVSRGIHTGARPEQPVPINLDAAEVLAGLSDRLSAWVRQLCQARGIVYVPVGYLPADFRGPTHPARPRVPPGHVETSTGEARWLHAHALTVRLIPTAGRIFTEVMAWTESAIATINAPTAAIYRGPCPAMVGGDDHRPVECGTPLYASPGEDYLTCGHCRTTYRVDKLEARLLARIGGTLFTVPELVRVLHELGEPVPRGTIVSWISRKQLIARAWRNGERVLPQPRDRTDRPMYRIDEVRKLRGTALRTGGS